MALIVTCCSLYLVMQICRIWITSELHLLHSKIWVDMTGTFDPVINHVSENEDKGLILRENEVKVLVIQSCPTVCNPMYCSPPGSSDHGILQVRILEWEVISSPADLPFPASQSNSGFLHYRQILYCLSHKIICCKLVAWSATQLSNFLKLFKLWKVYYQGFY